MEVISGLASEKSIRKEERYYAISPAGKKAKALFEYALIIVFSFHRCYCRPDNTWPSHQQCLSIELPALSAQYNFF